jgi:hypothetical protein
MAQQTTFGYEHEPVRTPQSVGMRVYWLVVTTLSLMLLGMTVHVATPRDAADIVETAATISR